MEDDHRKAIQASMQSLLEMDAALAIDCINYVFTQLNSESFVGVINQSEYNIIVRSATKGLSKIVFLKHYSRDLVAKTAFGIAARNLLILLYTRPLNGNDRDLIIKEFESKKAMVMPVGQGMHGGR